MGSTTSESAKKVMQNQNVAGGQLRLFSNNPPTGHYRDGFCRTGPEDPGNHSVAATMNEEFLNFTAARGNNLKDVGVTSGMNWCLCAHRWQEAMQAAQDGQLSQSAVPQVYLHASDKSALDVVSYKDLKRFARQEAHEASAGQGSHYDPKAEGSMTRESKDIGGDQPTETPGAGRWQGTGTKGEVEHMPRGSRG